MPLAKQAPDAPVKQQQLYLTKKERKRIRRQASASNSIACYCNTRYFDRLLHSAAPLCTLVGLLGAALQELSNELLVFCNEAREREQCTFVR